MRQERCYKKTYPLPQNITNIARSHGFQESFSVDSLGRTDPCIKRFELVFMCCSPPEQSVLEGQKAQDSSLGRNGHENI